MRGKSRESESLSPDLSESLSPDPTGGGREARGRIRRVPEEVAGREPARFPPPVASARGAQQNVPEIRFTIRAASAGASSEGSSFPGRARALPGPQLAGGPERQRYGEDEVGRGETAATGGRHPHAGTSCLEEPPAAGVLPEEAPPGSSMRRKSVGAPLLPERRVGERGAHWPKPWARSGGANIRARYPSPRRRRQ